LNLFLQLLATLFSDSITFFEYTTAGLLLFRLLFLSSIFEEGYYHFVSLRTIYDDEEDTEDIASRDSWYLKFCAGAKLVDCGVSLQKY
jgi:hypothetical protein